MCDSQNTGHKRLAIDERRGGCSGKSWLPCTLKFTSFLLNLSKQVVLLLSSAQIKISPLLAHHGKDHFGYSCKKTLHAPMEKSSDVNVSQED